MSALVDGQLRRLAVQNCPAFRLFWFYDSANARERLVARRLVDHLHLSDENSGEWINYMLEHLAPEERAEFAKGLAERSHDLEERPTKTQVHRFREWLDSWIIAMRLKTDEEFQVQYKEFVAKEKNGEVGPLLGADDLKNLLSS